MFTIQNIPFIYKMSKTLLGFLLKILKRRNRKHETR